MNVKPFYNSKKYYFLNLSDAGDSNSCLFLALLDFHAVVVLGICKDFKKIHSRTL